ADCHDAWAGRDGEGDGAPRSGTKEDDQEVVGRRRCLRNTDGDLTDPLDNGGYRLWRSYPCARRPAMRPRGRPPRRGDERSSLRSWSSSRCRSVSRSKKRSTVSPSPTTRTPSAPPNGNTSTA